MPFLVLLLSLSLPGRSTAGPSAMGLVEGTVINGVGGTLRDAVLHLEGTDTRFFLDRSCN